jgi:hypothetical protein
VFFRNKEQKETKGDKVVAEGKQDITTLTFMDSRVPYNMENVVASLLRKLITKEIITITDAREIFSGGEFYLH